MSRERVLPLIVLVAMGAAWGLTIPLTKYAVTAGYRDFGIIFWQFALGALVLGLILRLRGRPLLIAPRHWGFCLAIAVLGTLGPNWAGHTAAIHLPAGIMSIVISSVPLLAWPIAMVLGLDQFAPIRALGLALGFGAILLIALPESSLPDPAMAVWLPLALVAPAFYAIEGNYVAKRGTGGLDPVEVLFGASVIGMLIAGLLAPITGVWITPLPPYGLPDLAVVASALLHAGAYTGYVWLVGRAGAVFAAQVAYLVTAFGILWAALLLSESYSAWVWAALTLLFAGLFLVQPRPSAAHSTQAKGTGALQPGPGSAKDGAG